MADTVEMQDIRGLDIDKTVKGFALAEYVFKGACTISNTSADHIRWYQETAADLTATTPAKVSNISPLSTFPILEVSWTRQTSYVRKYAAEGFISMEDMKSSDIDVVARTLLRLTRAVVKQVDTRIWNVMIESGTAENSKTINFVTTSGAWNQNKEPIGDIMEAKRKIWEDNYNPEGAYLFMSPKTYEYLVTYLIDQKGSSIPNFSSEKVRSGVVMEILGVNVKVSNNATYTASGAALLVVPNRACTWKSHTDTTSVAINEPGIGTRFRVWELGEAILTDPNAVCWIAPTENA